MFPNAEIYTMYHSFYKILLFLPIVYKLFFYIDTFLNLFHH